MAFRIRVWVSVAGATAVGAACSLFTDTDALTTGAPAAPDSGPLEGAAIFPEASTADSAPADAGEASADSGDVGADADAGDAGGNGSCAEPDLIGAWNFDEGSGQTASDCSGMGGVGTLHDAGWTTGVHGSALRVVPPSWVSVLNQPVHEHEGPLTVAAYTRVIQFPGSSAYLIGKAYDPNVSGWRLGTEPNQTLSLVVATSAGLQPISSPAVSAGVWRHVAAVFQPGMLLIYVNGTAVGQSSINAGATLKNSGAEIRFGSRGDGAFFAHADIDEVRIYKRALTAVEIANLAGQ